MASIMAAISEYRPRILYGDLVDAEMLAEYIARGTALNPGEIYNVLRELRDAILFFNAKGMPVRLEDLGIFRPNVRLDGTYRVGFRMNSSIRAQMNLDGFFKGSIINSKNIGLTAQDLVDMWNSEHPDDPVQVPENSVG